jgi:hypothetical protein
MSLLHHECHQTITFKRNLQRNFGGPLFKRVKVRSSTGHENPEGGSTGIAVFCIGEKLRWVINATPRSFYHGEETRDPLHGI